MKIENIKDVSIFNFVRKTIMGGLSDSINPYVKLDDIQNEKLLIMILVLNILMN